MLRRSYQGVWGMPGRRVPKKDVVHYEKLRGGVCSRYTAGDIRMGKPAQGHACGRLSEHIAQHEGTGGTETSKYPEEKTVFRE